MAVTVTREEPVYRPDAGENDPRFFRDVLIWSTHRDPSARERLHRHQQEQRDIGSGVLGGAVVPQFLTEQAAGPVRAGDPLLMALEHLALPSEGVSFTVPRSVTTGGSTGHAQTSENTDVSETDPSMVDLTRSLVTVAGQVDVSRQVLDRGGMVAETYLARDLAEAVNTNLDYQLINGTGTNGQLLGLRNVTDVTTVTWTDATPSQGEFTTFIGRTAHDASVVRLLPADTVVLHPRRFFWLTGGEGSAGDLPNTARPWNYYDLEPPFVASFAHMNVVIDANIPTTLGAGTNEDIAIVMRRADTPVHIGPIMVDIDSQALATTLGLSVVAHRYATWFPDRYRGTSAAILTGTGLTAPTGFTN